MSAIEKELVEATGFEPTKNYERHDYLAALARAVNELGEDDFDALSIEAQDWFNDAVRALNKKKDLPDFPDLEEAEASEGEGDPEDEKSAEAEEPAEAEAEAEAEVEEKKPAKKVAKKKAKAEEEKPKRKKGQPPRKLDHPPIKKVSPDTKLEDLDISMDRYGIIKGTKNHAAAVMLEKGCRMADITESIGGTYYNLLQRLAKQGHLVEKSSNGELKLTHQDDVSKKGKGKK